MRRTAEMVGAAWIGVLALCGTGLGQVARSGATPPSAADLRPEDAGAAEPPMPPIPPPPKVLTPLAHVETVGTGPVHVVLIPTLGCDWTVWSGFMARHASEFTMHAVTLPGFGGSEPPPVEAGALYFSAPWMNNAEYAIVALIDRLKLERPIVMGHGMGGHLAIRVASRHADKVGAGVSVDGFPAMPLGGLLAPQVTWRLRQEMVDGIIQRDLNGIPEAQSRQEFGIATGSGSSNPARQKRLAEMAASVPVSTNRRYQLEWLAGDMIPEMPLLRVPCLVIAVKPPEDVEMVEVERELFEKAWQSQLAGAGNAYLTVIEDCRHFVMDERPEQFDRALGGFLQSMAEAGKAAWGGAMKAAPGASSGEGSKP